VFFSTFYAGKTVNELDQPYEHDRGMNLGYWMSKLAAEKLMHEASMRAMPVYIHRCPFIAGDSQSGLWKGEDFYYLMLKGCIEMGCAPDWDHEFDISPVNFISHSVVSAALQRQDGIFHLNNPSPILWNDLITQLNHLGYPVKLFEKNIWIKQLAEQIKTGNATLIPLWSLFREGLTGGSTMLDRLERSQLALMRNEETTSRLAGFSQYKCPRIDAELMQTYLSHMAKS
jgi:thioester reductase-like protein